jgi:hypothetical protein
VPILGRVVIKRRCQQLDYMAWNGGMKTWKGFGRKQCVLIVVLSQHVRKGTTENHIPTRDNPSPGRLEPRTSRMGAKSATAMPIRPMRRLPAAVLHDVRIENPYESGGRSALQTVSHCNRNSCSQNNHRAPCPVTFRPDNALFILHTQCLEYS